MKNSLETQSILTLVALLLHFVQPQMLLTAQKKQVAASQALADVIDEFFTRQHVLFDVIITKPSPRGFSQVIDATLAKLTLLQLMNITAHNWRKHFFYHITRSAVIFSERDPDFIEVNPQSDLTRLRFLVYTGACIPTPVIRVLNDRVKAHTVKVYGFFLCLRNSTTIQLTYNDWFQHGQCQKHVTKALNFFDVGSMQWLFPFRNIRRFRNLNRCEIRVRDSYEVSAISNRQPLVPFLKIVAEYANFTLKLHDTDFNTSVAMGSLTLSRYGILLTSTFWSQSIGLVVSKGEPYNAYEKLLLPFDLTTWLLLTVTFTTAFFVVFAVNHVHSSLRNVIFGEGVSMPAFNVMGSFFGISQTRLPKKSFARFILMMFILFCLVIRTAYQGVLFEFMTSDMRKPHAKTLEEVFERNFTVHIDQMHTGALFLAIFGSKPSNVEFLYVDNLNPHFEIKQFCPFLQDSVTNTAVVFDDNQYNRILRVCRRLPLKISQPIQVTTMGLSLDDNHYLFGAVEEAVKRAFEAGIIQHSIKSYWEYFQKYIITEPKEPTVLTIANLSYGFNIWLAALALAVVTFVCELIVWRLTRKNGNKVAADDINPAEVSTKENNEVEETEFVDKQDSLSETKDFEVVVDLGEISIAESSDEEIHLANEQNDEDELSLKNKSEELEKVDNSEHHVEEKPPVEEEDDMKIMSDVLTETDFEEFKEAPELPDNKAKKLVPS